MKRSKITKKALVFSIASILICILMLVGSTFAWFTDSVTGGNNLIKAGNLDIELYHSNRKQTREKVTDSTKLFEVDIWEPGVMAYENFEIANEGELALKYEFDMSIAEFNTVSETGKSLKDVLKVALIEGEEFTGEREALSNLTFDRTIEDCSKREVLLLKGTKSKFAIVVYWEPSDTDNDYNLSDGKTSSDNNPLFIDLGVNLIANQSTYELDSFGSDYDDNVVYTAATDALDLNNKMYRAKEGEGVRLTQDVTQQWSIPTYNQINIIDLDGHTLTIDAATSLPVRDGKTLVLKNGKLDLYKSNLTVSKFEITDNSTLILENMEVVANDSSAIYVTGKNATVDVINSTVSALGYAISTNANSKENYGVNINIKNSTINGNKDGAGIAVLLNVPGKLNIDGSTINGFLHGVVVRGGDAYIKNSTITNRTEDATVTNLENTIGTDEWGQGDQVPVAALVIGNRKAGAYQYPANVQLVNTKIIAEPMPGNTLMRPTLYMYGNEAVGLGAALTYDSDSVVGEIVRGNEYVTVNGE